MSTNGRFLGPSVKLIRQQSNFHNCTIPIHQVERSSNRRCRVKTSNAHHDVCVVLPHPMAYEHLLSWQNIPIHPCLGPVVGKSNKGLGWASTAGQHWKLKQEKIGLQVVGASTSVGIYAAEELFIKYSSEAADSHKLIMSIGSDDDLFLFLSQRAGCYKTQDFTIDRSYEIFTCSPRS